MVNYDKELLLSLEQALRDIWQTVQCSYPDHDWEKDISFRERLSETLIQLADGGVRDVAEFHRRVIDLVRLPPTKDPRSRGKLQAKTNIRS